MNRKMLSLIQAADVLEQILMHCGERRPRASKGPDPTCYEYLTGLVYLEHGFSGSDGEPKMIDVTVVTGLCREVEVRTNDALVRVCLSDDKDIVSDDPVKQVYWIRLIDGSMIEDMIYAAQMMRSFVGMLNDIIFCGRWDGERYLAETEDDRPTAEDVSEYEHSAAGIDDREDSPSLDMTLLGSYES